MKRPVWLWTTLSFWAYVFRGKTWAQRWCRFLGHAGPVWYSYADEPDMHCKACGEYLG